MEYIYTSQCLTISTAKTLGIICITNIGRLWKVKRRRQTGWGLEALKTTG